MSARSKARKRALDVLYEADQRAAAAQHDPESGERDAPGMLAVLSDRIAQPGTQAPLPQYAVQIVEGVHEHRARIDEALGTFARGWTLDRMPSVDRSILRLATWEILYNAEVPDAVAIDEAVSLAQSLSTDDSPSFINGLLGRISMMGPSLRD